MNTTKLITAGGTIAASMATVALMVWQEAQASRYDTLADPETQEAAAPVNGASILSFPTEAASAPEAPEASIELASLGSDFEIDTAPSAPKAEMVVETPALAAPEAPEPKIVMLEEPALPETDAPAEMPALAEAPDTTCAPILTAIAKPGARAMLTLSAPCHTAATLDVSHAGLTFSDRTSDMGTYTAEIPVLESPARMTVTLDDGTETDVSVEVPDLEAYERVALQWTGETGLSLHAFELGASWGEKGHVHTANSRDSDFAVGGRGGFMTVLGDGKGLTPKMAEIYTWPRDIAEAEGVVRLSIEAEVNTKNCGRDIAGQSFQEDDRGEIRPVSITLSMPSCDAQGEYLVLKNLLRDLKVASN